MKRIFKTNLLFLIQILIYIIFSVVISIMIKNGADFSDKAYQIQIIGTFIFLWLPAILYLLLRKNALGAPIKEILKLKKTKGSNFLFCFLIFLCLQPIAGFLNLITMLFIPNNVVEFMATLSSNGSDLLMILTVAVMPAIGEELVFRGIIRDGYKNTPLIFMALMNGLLFALFHMNPSQLLYAFVLGTVFTYVVEYTGSIFTTMFIHFVFNGLSCLLLILPKYLEKFGLSEKLAQESANTLTSVPFASYIFLFIIVVIASILLYMLLGKLKRDNGYDEKLALRSHTIEVDYDVTLDEFQGYSPKKSKVIAFTPIAISIAIFILPVILKLLA